MNLNRIRWNSLEFILLSWYYHKFLLTGIHPWFLEAWHRRAARNPARTAQLSQRLTRDRQSWKINSVVPAWTPKNTWKTASIDPVAIQSISLIQLTYYLNFEWSSMYVTLRYRNRFEAVVALVIALTLAASNTTWKILLEFKKSKTLFSKPNE